MAEKGSAWRVLGASVTGTSHLRMGRGCDDAHLYRIAENNTLFLAVADGAGSASQSARGAWTAVRAAIDAAESLLVQCGEPEHQEHWHVLLEAILQSAHLALQNLLQSELTNREHEREAHQEGSPLSLRDFATTLLVAIVTQHWVAIAQVGDGIAVAQVGDGTVASLYSRQPQRYINETDFLTDTAYLTSAAYVISPRAGLRGVALLTDGLELLATTYPEHTAFPAFFLPIFKFATASDATEAELRLFLESERVNSRTDDDKTLLLAVLS